MSKQEQVAALREAAQSAELASYAVRPGRGVPTSGGGDVMGECPYCVNGKRHDCRGDVFDCPWCGGRKPVTVAVCPCEGDDDEPGPHILSCPWADPNYDDGFMDDMPGRGNEDLN